MSTSAVDYQFADPLEPNPKERYAFFPSDVTASNPHIHPPQKTPQLQSRSRSQSSRLSPQSQGQSQPQVHSRASSQQHVLHPTDRPRGSDPASDFFASMSPERDIDLDLDIDSHDTATYRGSAYRGLPVHETGDLSDPPRRYAIYPAPGSDSGIFEGNFDFDEYTAPWTYEEQESGRGEGLDGTEDGDQGEGDFGSNSLRWAIPPDSSMAPVFPRRPVPIRVALRRLGVGLASDPVFVPSPAPPTAPVLESVQASATPSPEVTPPAAPEPTTLVLAPAPHFRGIQERLDEINSIPSLEPALVSYPSSSSTLASSSASSRPPSPSPNSNSNSNQDVDTNTASSVTPSSETVDGQQVESVDEHAEDWDWHWNQRSLSLAEVADVIGADRNEQTFSEFGRSNSVAVTDSTFVPETGTVLYSTGRNTPVDLAEREGTSEGEREESSSPPPPHPPPPLIQDQTTPIQAPVLLGPQDQWPLSPNDQPPSSPSLTPSSTFTPALESNTNLPSPLPLAPPVHHAALPSTPTRPVSLPIVSINSTPIPPSAILEAGSGPSTTASIPAVLTAVTLTPQPEVTPPTESPAQLTADVTQLVGQYRTLQRALSVWREHVERVRRESAVREHVDNEGDESGSRGHVDTERDGRVDRERTESLSRERVGRQRGNFPEGERVGREMDGVLRPGMRPRISRERERESGEESAWGERSRTRPERETSRSRSVRERSRSRAEREGSRSRQPSRPRSNSRPRPPPQRGMTSPFPVASRSGTSGTYSRAPPSISRPSRPRSFSPSTRPVTPPPAGATFTFRPRSRSSSRTRETGHTRTQTQTHTQELANGHTRPQNQSLTAQFDSHLHQTTSIPLPRRRGSAPPLVRHATSPLYITSIEHEAHPPIREPDREMHPMSPLARTRSAYFREGGSEFGGVDRHGHNVGFNESRRQTQTQRRVQVRRYSTLPPEREGVNVTLTGI